MLQGSQAGIEGPWVGVTWCPYHLPAIQPDPSTWGLGVCGLSVSSHFIQAASSALAGSKGDAGDVCIPEGEEVDCPEPGLLTGQERPPKGQGSSCFPSPHEWSLSQPLRNCLTTKKAASFLRPAAPRFGSVLCLWVMPVPLVLSLVLWATSGELPRSQSF